ncbi:MAG: hypothetical protein M1820_001337 [Bogoriella megaspora]|nr:MAG: hypothetical protein M1820_001337 [Bogoriella megaspora]
MQGFNMGRYVPPDYEGTVSANKLVGKHALGARANKIREGILTVRFELPFAIWCNTCPPETIIGQGVRFNAEKKKVGNYYSTPIYSFRFKHNACGGIIEIRTDPRNTAYVVTEGAKKRGYGEDKEATDDHGNVIILTEEEREKRRNDAFARLEGNVEDKAKAKTDIDRVKELQAHSNKYWEDPGLHNRRLRDSFRKGRKVREIQGEHDEQLRDRAGLAIDLLERSEEDARRASQVDFGGSNDGDMDKVLSRPLFGTPATTRPLKPDSSSSRKQKPTPAAALGDMVKRNTRAADDPFLSKADEPKKSFASGSTIPGLKRKLMDDSMTSSPASKSKVSKAKSDSLESERLLSGKAVMEKSMLVSYSDSD